MEINLFGLRIFLEIPYNGLTILILLLIGLSIAYWFMIQLRKKRVVKFGNFETLKKVEGYKRFSLSPVLFVIRALVIILLFLVATESIQVNVLRPVANANIMLALDVSSTMLMPDYEPNRLEAAKKAATKLISKLPEATKIGIVTFSAEATPFLGPTNDVSKVKSALKKLTVSNEAGTAMGDTLKLSASILNKTRPKKDKIVILFTDGKNNVGTNLTDAVRELKEEDVTVYAIGIGNNNKTIEMYNELTEVMRESGYEYTSLNFPELDTESLENITKLTGGKFFLINDEKSMEESLSNLSVRNERIPLNSEYYILLFITIFMIVELILFSKYGAI